MSRARAWLELARISNLPTVFTNVMVGTALALASTPGMVFRWNWFGWACLSVTFLYVAGMILNDAVDAPVDARERPSRPIPSGRVSRRAAFVAAAIGLALGVAALLPHGPRAVLWGVGLAASIVLYDVLHKRVAASIVLMGVCRGLVYFLAAEVAGGGGSGVVLGTIAGGMTVYIFLLTLLARGEHANRAGPRVAAELLLPLVALVPALVVHAPAPATPIIAGVVAVTWIVRSSRMLRRDPPEVPRAVMGWLAAICLIDAYSLTLLDQLVPAAAAVGCFLLTALGHRSILGS